MNSRRLTYINEDVQEVLTPGHLLIGKRIIEPNSTGAECDEELNSVRLSKRMKYIKTLTDHYWVRWKHEYLIELRNSHIENFILWKSNVGRKCQMKTSTGPYMTSHSDSITMIILHLPLYPVKDHVVWQLKMAFLFVGCYTCKTIRYFKTAHPRKGRNVL